jgi:ankyrin repeat protein
VVEELLGWPGIQPDLTVAGWSALHEVPVTDPVPSQACFVNNVAAVRGLVAAGAALNPCDRDGYTPTMVALWFQRVEALRCSALPAAGGRLPREMLALPGASLQLPDGSAGIEELAGWVALHYTHAEEGTLKFFIW